MLKIEVTLDGGRVDLRAEVDGEVVRDERLELDAAIGALIGALAEQYMRKPEPGFAAAELIHDDVEVVPRFGCKHAHVIAGSCVHCGTAVS